MSLILPYLRDLSYNKSKLAVKSKGKRRLETRVGSIKASLMSEGSYNIPLGDLSSTLNIYY